MAYIEIKARKYIDATLAQLIIDKQTVVGIVCTGRISAPAKKLFDRAGIAWAEQISEEYFLQAERVEGRDARH